MVSHDRVVGPPRHLQWTCGPAWSRHHDHMASMSSMVASGGRVFYIFDEGPTSSIRLPSNWFILGRDAFSGALLWKRPLATWNTQMWPLKSGPGEIPRRLVAVGDRVYVPLGLDTPLSALDAATGETVRTYDNTKNTEEVILSDGVLYVQVNPSPSRWASYKQKFSYVWENTQNANSNWAWDQEHKRQIVAIQGDTGKTLWQLETPIVLLTLAVNRDRLFFHDGDKIVCLDAKTGSPVWKSGTVSRRSPLPVSYGPTLVAYKDYVLFAGGDRNQYGLSAKDGKILWSAPHPRSGHSSPEDLFVINDLVYAGQVANATDPGTFTGRDLLTGEVRNQFDQDVNIDWFHHRCYRSKATDNYIMCSRNGIEFVDPKANHWETHHWVRGGCLYGIMPANGMIYVPPQSCGCYLESKLNNFTVLTPESPTLKLPATIPEDGRLERGPAYGMDVTDSVGADDWPTYRHDAARSGATKSSVPADLKRAWQADLGGKLSGVTIAGDKLFVASVDTHTVHAIDASSGKTLWSYTTGGRVDSPPTIHQGRVLFGSHDGWVYCLRASDGGLAWRYRAAPVERRMVANEQIESSWPVPGNVLVQGDSAYCVAGRSMFLDGGMRLVRLDAKTGRKISETVLDDKDPDTGKNLQSRVRKEVMPVALPDVLSCDGQRIYMRSQRFDLQGKRLELGPLEVTDQTGEGTHLFCHVGFLDDTYFHRAYWTYGKAMNGGYGGWPMAGRYAVAGRLMVFDDSTVYGYGRKPEYYVNTSVLEFHLFAADKQVTPDAIDEVKRAANIVDKQSTKKNANGSDWALRQLFPVKNLTAAKFKWSFDKTPFQVRAMVLAGKNLFLAGPPDLVNEKESFARPDDPVIQSRMRDQVEALAGKKGAVLVAMAGGDGNKLAAFKLDSPPVFDGMAAANGRMFMSTMDGKVMCLASAGDVALSRADVELPATQFKTTAPTPLPQSDSAPTKKGKGKGKRKQ